MDKPSKEEATAALQAEMDGWDPSLSRGPQKVTTIMRDGEQRCVIEGDWDGTQFTAVTIGEWQNGSVR